MASFATWATRTSVLLSILFLILCIAPIATPSAHAQLGGTQEPLSKNISDRKAWYRALNMPGNMVTAALAFGVVGISVVCVVTSGIIRAILCMAVCFVFIAFLEPKTFSDPFKTYPAQITKLRTQKDLDVIIWATAHVVTAIFGFLLFIAVGKD